MVFAILMCFTRQYIFPILAIFFSGLSALSVLGSENLLMKTFTSTLMLEFVFGCGIGVLYLRDTVFSRNLPILFMAAGMLLFPFLSLYFPDLDRCIVLGIPSALLILGAVFLERKGSWPNFPIMHRIGDSSYSLYLTHIFTLPIVMGILLKIDAKHSLHGDLVCVALVFVAAFVGYAVHKLVEKPVDQYLRGLLISRADGGVP